MATKRILIADDSLTIQKAFAMTFAGEDVTLLAARSADEGLTIARQARPELVIADAVMPGRSGYDLCVAIKSDPTLRGVPVYILASSQNPYDEVRGRQSGADGQLLKPFESVVLVERVKEAIAKGASAPLVEAEITPPPVSRPAAVAAAAAVPANRGGGAVVQAGPPSPIDDDYGEISIEDSGRQVSPPATAPAVPAAAAASLAASEVTPPPVVPLAPPRPAAPMATTAGIPGGGLRPSLIPGLRPGAAPPPARPGLSMPARPAAAPGLTGHAAAGATAHPMPPAFGPGTQTPIATPHQVPALRAPYPQAVPGGVGPARTLVGLPANVAQPPVRFGAPSAPARPPTQPVRPLDGVRTPPPVVNAPLFPASAAAATVASKIDQKVAAIAATGPEYEAIAKLSREIIEKIVWEVVPELAELIIREELQKRGRV